MKANNSPASVSPEVLRPFKRQAKGYIRWHKKSQSFCDCVVPEHDDDCREITRAKTFEQVEAVLSKYDNGDFLALVEAGYF